MAAERKWRRRFGSILLWTPFLSILGMLAQQNALVPRALQHALLPSARNGNELPPERIPSFGGIAQVAIPHARETSDSIRTASKKATTTPQPNPPEEEIPASEDMEPAEPLDASSNEKPGETDATSVADWTSQQSVSPQVVDAPAISSKTAPLDPNGIHVCFCTDDPDLRPLAVAINSTLKSTREPLRVVFHVVTAPDVAPYFSKALRAAFPNTRIEVHYDAKLQARITALVNYKKSSGARKSLSSPFNFAPFYLDVFLKVGTGGSNARRLIYLDTDVLINGDILELHTLNLEGHAVAAVEDCSQKFEMYIDIPLLQKKGLKKVGIEAKACVYNRGIFVVDVPTWRTLGITPEIELWMKRYRESKQDLYKYGMSQPPWLLAVRGRYHRLSLAWNCRGLGREFLGPKELDSLKKAGFSQALLTEKLSIQATGGNYFKPFVSLCTRDARLLHFNGALKPWKRDKFEGKKPPLCAIPSTQGVHHFPSKKVKVVKDASFVDCPRLWNSYLSDEANVALVSSRKQA